MDFFQHLFNFNPNTLKKLLEPGVVLFFLVSVSLLFGGTIRKFKRKKEKKVIFYSKAFEPIKQKALETTNPKYLHLLYKEVYKMRNRIRRDPVAYQTATEVMKFILERINAVTSSSSQENNTATPSK